MSNVAYRLKEGSIIVIHTGSSSNPVQDAVTFQVDDLSGLSFQQVLSSYSVAITSDQSQNFSGTTTFLKPISAPPAILETQLITLGQMLLLLSGISLQVNSIQIGSAAKIVPVDSGCKIQVSSDGGTTWNDTDTQFTV